ncbi:hypothetical protein LIER_00054 [Lithospermum erythrorhizon]|uniref:Pentatricopeptide repeat-containing protein n=1 Tax=Lithospermum erythrorhizon TaxID=34254 RepID=A0AAV3NG33_LITER
MSASSFRTILTRFQTIASKKNYFDFKNHLNSCSSLSELKCIHAIIIITGSSQNLFVVTKLVSLACSLSHTMYYARKVFDELPHCRKDVFLWNNVIRGYANLGPCQESIVLYREMHREGVFPDNYTYPFVVRSCAVIAAAVEGREVHCSVIKRALDCDVFVQSALITMYAQCGVMLDARLVFCEMGVRNIVSWTAMISGYVQNGMLEEGLDTLRELVVAGDNKPNAITLASALPACSLSKYFYLGMVIHCYGVKLGLEKDVTLVNGLIAFYGKCGNVKKARSLFNNMEVRSLVSWNAMIAAYEQNDAGSSAIKLFRRMLKERSEFDHITMVSVISACTSLGALGTGEWAYELIKRRELENNVAVINALVDMYAKCGNLDFAKEVFSKLPYRTVVSWTAIIGAFASHGRGEEALNLFQQMKGEGIRPNSLTFISVLTACRHSGLVEEGRQHYESMIEDYSLTPCLEHCACMVDLLGRAGKLIEAYEFIGNMPIQPNAGIWEALLGACRIHSNVELAELIAKQLIRQNCDKISLYVLMKNIYAEAGRWENATRVRMMLEEKELKRTAGRSFVEMVKGSMSDVLS